MINLHATSNVDVYILGQKTIKGKGEEIYQFYIGQGLVGLVYFLITLLDTLLLWPFRKCLKVETVSTYSRLKVETVSTFSQLKEETVSTFNKLKVETIDIYFAP